MFATLKFGCLQCKPDKLSGSVKTNKKVSSN